MVVLQAMRMRSQVAVRIAIANNVSFCVALVSMLIYGCANDPHAWSVSRVLSYINRSFVVIFFATGTSMENTFELQPTLKRVSLNPTLIGRSYTYIPIMEFTCIYDAWRFLWLRDGWFSFGHSCGGLRLGIVDFCSLE